MAVYTEGISTVSENILLNPQICGDDSSPYPVLSNTEMDIAVFTTASVSAANSLTQLVKLEQFIGIQMIL